MLTLIEARKIIASASKKAVEIGQPMNIAIVDGGGNLLAFERMEGAWLGSIDISMKKAWTSRAFDISTQQLSGPSQPGQQFYGIHASNDGKVMIFAGGIPLKKDGKIIGAIGVSGGSGEQDQAVAEAGDFGTMKRSKELSNGLFDHFVIVVLALERRDTLFILLRPDAACAVEQQAARGEEGGGVGEDRVLQTCKG
jgi:uncharacterized protein GlcG (DUF336 family)